MIQGDYSQGNVFSSSTFNAYVVVKVLFSLCRDWNKSIMCNGSPFHLGAVRKQYGFPDLELSRHALKKELLKAKFLIKARPSNSSSFDKVISIDCRGRAKFTAKHNEMKSHYAKSFSACVLLFFSSILTRRFDFIRRDKIYLIKKSVKSIPGWAHNVKMAYPSTAATSISITNFNWIQPDHKTWNEFWDFRGIIGGNY